MAKTKDNPTRRHAFSAVAAIAFNAVLVWLLATASARPRNQPAAPLRAVPLTVVPPEPIAAEFAPPSAAAMPPDQTQPPQPAPPPALPPLALPQLPPMRTSVAALPLPALVASAHPDVPTYLIEPASPAAAPGPVAIPSPAPGAPKVGIPTDTRGPALLGQPNLADYYPRRALLRGTTGRTRVRLTIDATGRVTDVQVLESSPAGVFDHAAGRVGRVLTFQPAIDRGRPVPAVVSLDIVWRVQ